MRNCKKEKSGLCVLLAILAALAVLAGIGALIFKFVRKEYNPDDCELDFENCCDCDSESCEECASNGLKFAAEDEFENN